MNVEPVENAVNELDIAKVLSEVDRRWLKSLWREEWTLCRGVLPTSSLRLALIFPLLSWAPNYQREAREYVLWKMLRPHKAPWIGDNLLFLPPKEAEEPYFDLLAHDPDHTWTKVVLGRSVMFHRSKEDAYRIFSLAKLITSSTYEEFLKWV